MNQEEFIKDIENSYARGIALIRIKNADYADGSDPFKNFRTASLLGLTIEQAIMVRKLDKITRIGNLLTKEAAVKTETIEDTILDDINYAGILLAYLHAKSKAV